MEVPIMAEMYNIARYIPMSHPNFPGALNGEESYHGLEKAKIAMRETVTEKFGESAIVKITNKIDEYCQKYYPDNTPSEFLKLKELIANVITDPSFPKSQEELEQNYGWFNFEDERISFSFKEDFVDLIEETGDMVPALQIDIFDDDDKEMFIEGYINCFIMKDLPEDDMASYRCWLSAGVYMGLDINLYISFDDEF